eukprot:6178280-Pleurochrysis_carterae.AAC.2
MERASRRDLEDERPKGVMRRNVKFERQSTRPIVGKLASRRQQWANSTSKVESSHKREQM